MKGDVKGEGKGKENDMVKEKENERKRGKERKRKGKRERVIDRHSNKRPDERTDRERARNRSVVTKQRYTKVMILNYTDEVDPSQSFREILQQDSTRRPAQTRNCRLVAVVSTARALSA